MSDGSPYDPDEPRRGDSHGQMPPPSGEPYGGYQSMPDLSAGASGPAPAAATPPQSILTAVKLMYVGAAISLIGLLVSLFSMGDMRSQVEDTLRKQGKKVDSSTVDAAVTTGIVLGVVTGLIAIGLWIWMARMNQAGRSWARVVATVLGVLNVLFTLLALAQATSTAIAIIVNVVSVLLALAILFLLWRRESSEYYAARSAPRG